MHLSKPYKIGQIGSDMNAWDTDKFRWGKKR
jgi:hypothetical protein